MHLQRIYLPKGSIKLIYMTRGGRFLRACLVQILLCTFIALLGPAYVLSRYSHYQGIAATRRVQSLF